MANHIFYLHTRILILTILSCIFLVSITSAQTVGDRVLLSERSQGIPGHPAPGNNSVSHRFQGGTIVTVTDIDPETTWLHVEDVDGNTAWIIQGYVVETLAQTSPPSTLCYQVGTWNLEHFHSGKSRGFPENTHGGPTYPPRTAEDYAATASLIRDSLDAKILVLNEINGEDRHEEDGIRPRSAELDTLLSYLGPSYQYVITKAGGAQRVALLFDTRYARLNAAAEMTVPRIEVQGSDIFARDPLVGNFTFLHNGQPQNDLVMVALHLASGQNKTQNHDQAMTLLLQRLKEMQQEGIVNPVAEKDWLLAGDLNASMFDSSVEQFFTNLNTGNWVVLAGSSYPATRLAGNDLKPVSQIDYLIATRKTADWGGLFGEEVTEAQATVHQELAHGEWEFFRRTYSDHFPVTTCVSVGVDND